jgi:DNA-binding response OmpR family regulator
MKLHTHSDKTAVTPLFGLVLSAPRQGSCVTDPSRSPVPARVRRILVVDDEENTRHFISTALAGAGFDVNAASDGEQAWEALQHEIYDLLVTDNEMPRLAGIKLIERIRDAGMSLPIIMASGSFSMEGVRDYAQLQIAALIPKPFDIWEFLTIVRTALRVSAEDAAADLGTFQQLHAVPQPIR